MLKSRFAHFWTKIIISNTNSSGSCRIYRRKLLLLQMSSLLGPALPFLTRPSSFLSLLFSTKEMKISISQYLIIVYLFKQNIPLYLKTGFPVYYSYSLWSIQIQGIIFFRIQFKWNDIIYAIFTKKYILNKC